MSQPFQSQVERIAAALTEHGQTLAVVECTLGGALGAALTGVAGASSWFVGGLAPYAARAKERLLGLSGADFGDEGAVSARAARLMAEAARARLGATWALAETGIAGPRGQRRSAKEPGTAFICLIGPDGAAHERTLATGQDDRAANRRAFLTAALDLLVERLSAV
ncbi:MAG TPA: CinA family protein [Chloroflexota bacterium]|jgi:PncC family amidohydrolase|nr:CinA family protein [Chloroflexota bacterium]